MKTTITKRILSSVCLTALLLSLIAAVTGCADVSELETSGRTMIYAPSFDGSVNVPTTDAGNVTPDQTEAPVTTAAPKDTVYSFLAAGDNIIHEAVYTDAHKRAENGTGYNFLPMYDGIADLIKDADISFVNQEGPIAGIKYGISGYPNFNAPDEAGQTLVELGFDIVNIANNHMLDKWESGLLATIDYWETKDVLLLGAYRDQADYDSIRVYTCPDGTKIAFLSYTYGTNGMKLTSGSKHIIPWIDPDDITRQVRLAKEVGDLVFVSIHWGTESSFEETGEQHTLAQLMADNGVDVVIGHHPHVLQSVEWIDGKNGNKTLVAYSIGNMLSTMLTSNYMVGAFMTFDIRITPAGERSIENPVMIPIMCHYNDKRAGLQVYKLEDYTEDLANAHGAQLNKKFNMAALYGYVTDNIADEFLPKSFLDKAK